MKIKFFLSLFLVLLFCIGSVITCCAATFTPYQGITNSSSQVSLLYGYYRNLDTFSYDDEFIIMRSGQYDYYLFYGDLSSDSVFYISYLGNTQSGYNTVYEISMGLEDNFSYVLNEYSVVGNIPGSIAYSEHYSSFTDFTIQIAAFSLLIIFIFYVFRSHIKELNS
ncbi:MAG: hypothetical protein J6A97_00715 [Clostridia bacterium]|nr:hypothetical protein [Clostridia bacterium]